MRSRSTPVGSGNDHAATEHHCLALLGSAATASLDHIQIGKHADHGGIRTSEFMTLRLQNPAIHQRLKREPRTRYATLDRANGNAGNLGNLFIWHAGGNYQNEGFALIRRNLFKAPHEVSKLHGLVLTGRRGQDTLRDQAVPLSREALTPRLAEVDVPQDG